MNYIIDRLNERSTWIGLISLAAGLGVVISPILVEAIIAVGLSLAGLISIITPDKNNDAQ